MVRPSDREEGLDNGRIRTMNDEGKKEDRLVRHLIVLAVTALRRSHDAGSAAAGNFSSAA